MRNSQSHSTKPIGTSHNTTCDLLKGTTCERKLSVKIWQ